MHESLDDARREAGLLHRDLRLLGQHEAAGGQARDQRGLANRLAVMSRHPDEALQQGVVDFSGRRQGLFVQSRLGGQVGARGIVFHEVLLRGCALMPRLTPRHGVRLMRRSKQSFRFLCHPNRSPLLPIFFAFPFVQDDPSCTGSELSAAPFRRRIGSLLIAINQVIEVNCCDEFCRPETKFVPARARRMHRRLSRIFAFGRRAKPVGRRGRNRL
ncbi:hypothetical protein [Caballeronia arationis]|uniref:hypothetical protein n=1 Tax=Caballeronia arationis TaxID=1777142 RepID=UPI001180F9D4|nr:hypothetical protein [Caballeronia arationis]